MGEGRENERAGSGWAMGILSKLGERQGNFITNVVSVVCDPGGRGRGCGALALSSSLCIYIALGVGQRPGGWWEGKGNWDGGRVATRS